MDRALNELLEAQSEIETHAQDRIGRRRFQYRWFPVVIEDELASAYRTMSARLGPRVLLTPMIKADGLEMLLGMVTDPQFGPLVIMGIGGVQVEALRDVVSVLPPFDANTALRLLKGLQHAALLDCKRGGGVPDINSFCEAAALFSSLVASLGDVIEELDMNPIIVHAGGCLAVDALIVTSGSNDQTNSTRNTA